MAFVRADCDLREWISQVGKVRSDWKSSAASCVARAVGKNAKILNAPGCFFIAAFKKKYTEKCEWITGTSLKWWKKCVSTLTSFKWWFVYTTPECEQKWKIYWLRVLISLYSFFILFQKVVCFYLNKEQSCGQTVLKRSHHQLTTTKEESAMGEQKWRETKQSMSYWVSWESIAWTMCVCVCVWVCECACVYMWVQVGICVCGCVCVCASTCANKLWSGQHACHVAVRRCSYGA